MNAHPSSHIENLGLHGPQVAQRLADRGAVSRQPDGLSQVGEEALAEVHDARIQELLETAAHFPLPVIDRAGGVADAADPLLMWIPLVNASGVSALIETEDYPLVRRYRWRLDWSGKYAVAGLGLAQMRMHRVVMMVGPNLEVDHKNRDTLDNRSQNLRACTHAENMWNMKRSTRNSTGIKGVVVRGDKFMATVTARKQVHKQEFDDLELATAWVTATRTQLHGEFARHD